MFAKTQAFGCIIMGNFFELHMTTILKYKTYPCRKWKTMSEFIIVSDKNPKKKAPNKLPIF